MDVGKIEKSINGVRVMASPNVHDKTGKSCARCGKVFDKTSFNITLSKRNQDIKSCLQKETVCGTCHHKHYEDGE